MKEKRRIGKFEILVSIIISLVYFIDIIIRGESRYYESINIVKEMGATTATAMIAFGYYFALSIIILKLAYLAATFAENKFYNRYKKENDNG
jgi:hypothetical protein